MDFADPAATIIASLSALAATAMLVTAGYRGFIAWIALKRAELDCHATAPGQPPSAVSRIELADLKERIRKLEAIASGVAL